MLTTLNFSGSPGSDRGAKNFPACRGLDVSGIGIFLEGEAKSPCFVDRLLSVLSVETTGGCVLDDKNTWEEF